MKYFYQILREISLFFYLFILYQVWHLCQYGGVRRHLAILLFGGFVFLISFIFGIFLKRGKLEGFPRSSHKKKLFCLEMILFFIGTFLFGGKIIYSAIPYNGALSWKIDEWMRKKEVKLEHNNFFKDGVEGVLQDLDKALDLPEELYIANKYQMAFDETGEIQSIYTFLYGRDEKGETKTYLVDYDASKDENMTVWVDGKVNGSYEENMRFEPMLKILQKADCKAQVKGWSANKVSSTYEILYMGRRSFETAEKLRYIPGDGDSIENGNNLFFQLQSGGEINAFEISLYSLEAKEVELICYIMEPEYISQQKLNEEHQQQQVKDAKDTESWTVDRNDGTMYFFLDESIGWRLVVTDAAAGSRFYELEKTKNSGTTWEKLNADPFDGEIGVTEGLVFFDENLGFAGLTGASQSFSRLYMTKDGGESFTKLQLPMDEVIELPKSAQEYNLTIQDYDYLYMPEKEGDKLSIRIVTQNGEKEGVVFQSEDNGEIWKYVK